MGSYSVVQCVRCLMGQPLYCSAADAGVWREAMAMAPPPTHDSAVAPCFQVAHQAFPTTIPSLTSPLSISPQSPTTITLGLLHNPYTPVPSRCTFQGTSIPVWGMYGSGKDCLILIPFTLPQISCFTLSLRCFSSDSDIAPMVGIRPLLQFLHQVRASPVLLTLLFFPLVPLSYQVLHGSIYYFPLVRYSCPLSAGTLHTLLCLKVYS